MGHGGACSVDHLRPKVGVSALADLEQPRLAAGGILTGHQAKPRGEISTSGERQAIADGCDQGGGDDNADAGDARQVPCSVTHMREFRSSRRSPTNRRARSPRTRSSGPSASSLWRRTVRNAVIGASFPAKNIKARGHEAPHSQAEDITAPAPPSRTSSKRTLPNGRHPDMTAPPSRFSRETSGI